MCEVLYKVCVVYEVPMDIEGQRFFDFFVPYYYVLIGRGECLFDAYPIHQQHHFLGGCSISKDGFGGNGIQWVTLYKLLSTECS